jgi:hypothetical protein
MFRSRDLKTDKKCLWGQVNCVFTGKCLHNNNNNSTKEEETNIPCRMGNLIISTIHILRSVLNRNMP